MYHFQLVEYFGTVGVEIDLRLLQVQTRHGAYGVSFFHYAEPFAREAECRTQIAQARFLAYQVVVFGRDVGSEVFNGQTRVQFSHKAQFLEPCIFSLYA